MCKPGRDGMVEHPIVTWRVAGWTGFGNGMRSKKGEVHGACVGV